MRESEADWRGVIKRSYDSSAEHHGIDRGEGPEVSVQIRIKNLDSGSQALRYFLGFGAGSASVTAEAEAGEYGSMRAEGSISAGFFGGKFDGLLFDLGRAIAGELADARR